MKQITDTILMIRPTRFRMNEETAANNYFQEDIALDKSIINTRAQSEFDTFTNTLKNHGINVVIIEDSNDDTPDSIFPNNWVSFHEDAKVCLYPMFAPNRRKERNKDILISLKELGFVIDRIMDYSIHEHDALFLEGTGSLILDRKNRKAYCALSDRADKTLVRLFCKDNDFAPIIFHSYQTVQDDRLAIYHTNVMMCLGSKIAIICSETIDDLTERKEVITALEEDYKDVLHISERQMHQFAGNMLQVCNKQQELFMIMSSSAYQSLHVDQIKMIKKSSTIIHSDLSTIEQCGGGSARCMMAEVFLPKL